jgi:thiamine biosynthesis lipoprotein ApbE
MRWLSLFALTAILAGALLTPTSLRAGRENTYVFHHENVLGTSLELKLNASTAGSAALAEAAVLREIARQAGILSSYDPQSEFSRWQRTPVGPVRVSPELLEVLGLFDTWRQRSNGALDASAEAVVRVWKTAAAQQRLPTPEETAGAVAMVRQAHWRLDTAAGTAERLDTTPIALNSFAKSYIASRAGTAAMQQDGVTGVVVNLGGDLVVRGPVAERVSIADPLSDAENGRPIAQLLVTNRAVATSGNYRRGVSIGGRWYSHIVDPRTGLPVDHVVSATVVAPNAADAGALATAFNVLRPEEAERVGARTPGVEFLLVAGNGRRITSRGWAALEAPRAAMAAAAPAPAPGTWNPAYELNIGVELSRFDGQPYRRPFVAVWIEDQDHYPVRTLALWFDKSRWLPDLKQWYRGERLRSMTEGNDLTTSVSSATRPPGKYTLKWDGKDQAGKPVKAGKYTVCIEAAREHGTYQVMRQEMDFSGSAKQAQLPGNVEIAGATLEYRKVAQ